MIIERTPVSDAMPFDLAELHGHCRTSGIPDFDADLIRMGSATAAEFEVYTQTALLEQEVTVTLEDGTPRTVFYLPFAPVLDALSVTVTVDGEERDSFAVTAGQRPAIRFPDGRPRGLTVITYTAGFGETVEDLPRDIVNAIYDQTLAYFDARGPGDGKTNGMSPHMARIAARYRRVAL